MSGLGNCLTVEYLASPKFPLPVTKTFGKFGRISINHVEIRYCDQLKLFLVHFVAKFPSKMQPKLFFFFFSFCRNFFQYTSDRAEVSMSVNL